MFDTLFVTQNVAAARRARGLPFATLVHVGALGAALAASHVVMEVVQDPDISGPITWTTFAPPPPLGDNGGGRPPRARVAAPVAKRTEPSEPVQPNAPPVALSELPQTQAAAPSEPGPDGDENGVGGTGTGTGPYGSPDGVPNGTGSGPWGTGLLDRLGAAEPVYVTDDMKAPVLLEKISPDYPETARRVRIEGRVILRATIGLDGRVENVTVLSGNPLLTEAAADAVRRWRYSPATLGGAPVRVYFSAVVWFKLE